MRTCQDNSGAYLCYAVKPNKNNGVIAAKPEHLLPLLFHKKINWYPFDIFPYRFNFLLGRVVNRKLTAF